MLSSSSDNENSSAETLRRKRRTLLSSGAVEGGALGVYRQRRFCTPKTGTRSQSDILRMLETETLHKESLSPFIPLPAIGQGAPRGREERRARQPRDIRLESLEARKSSAPDYFVLSVPGDDFRKRKETAPLDAGKVLNELNLKTPMLKSTPDLRDRGEMKSDRSRRLLRQSTYDVLDPLVVRRAQIDGAKRVPRPLVEPTRDFNYFSRLGPDPRPRDRRQSENIQPLDGERDRTDNKLHSSKNEDSPSLEKSCGTILLCQKLFEKKGKLLDRRRRESFSEIAGDEMTSGDAPGKHLEDIKFYSSSEEDSSSRQPKMRDLIEIFDSLNVNHKYKSLIKKDNNWF